MYFVVIAIVMLLMVVLLLMLSSSAAATAFSTLATNNFITVKPWCNPLLIDLGLFHLVSCVLASVNDFLCSVFPGWKVLDLQMYKGNKI